MECNNKNCLFNAFGSCCHESEEGYEKATPNELDCPSSLRKDLEENMYNAVDYIKRNLSFKRHKELTEIVNLMEKQKKEREVRNYD